MIVTNLLLLWPIESVSQNRFPIYSNSGQSMVLIKDWTKNRYWIGGRDMNMILFLNTNHIPQLNGWTTRLNKPIWPIELETNLTIDTNCNNNNSIADSRTNRIDISPPPPSQLWLEFAYQRLGRGVGQICVSYTSQRSATD